jgi:hypothetical protein
VQPGRTAIVNSEQVLKPCHGSRFHGGLAEWKGSQR